MASISEGITVEGEAANNDGDLSQSAFDSMLAEQATKSYDAPTAAGPEERRDVSSDSIEQVYRDVLAPTSGTADIREGLSVAVPEPVESRREPLDAENAKLVQEAQRQLVREQSALERGADAVDELAARDALDLVRAGDGEGALEAYVGLAERGPALLDQALWDAAVILSGLNPSDVDLEDDEDAVADFTETLDVLSAQVSAARNEKAFVAAAEKVAALSTMAQAQDVAAQKSAISEWQADLGLSAAEARARVEVAEAVCPDLFGVELSAITDPSEFDAALRACDSTVAETGSAIRTRQIQESVLGATSTNVRGGLEVLGPLGYQPIVEQTLDRFGPPVPTPDRTAARATRHRHTADDIRRSVLAPEWDSVASGLTVGGKSVSVDQATGAIERAAQERRDAIARDRGLLR
jgi:hypothetical protein